jgi:hypothetical protein
MKIISALLFSLFALSTFAQPKQGNGPQGGEHRGPPPEALAACKTAKADAACSFKGRQSEIVKGTCWAPDKSKPLACKPAGGPPSMQGGQRP